MITATGNMRFTTSTDAAALLRSLIDLVDDLEFSGIAVEVSVRIGDAQPVGTVHTEPASLPAVEYRPWPPQAYSPPVVVPLVDSPAPHAITTNGTKRATPSDWINWGAYPAVAADLDAGTLTWRSTPLDTRHELARRVALATAKDCGTYDFTQADFNEHAPAWMPAAASFPTKQNVTWPEVRRRWLGEPTPEAVDDTASFRAAS